MSDMNKCPAQVYGSSVWIRGHKCDRSAAYEHEGVFYCKTHHPPTIKAKAERKTAEFNAKWDARIAASSKEREAKAELERRAACFDEMLAALQCAECHHLDSLGDWLPEVRAAIAKATQP